MALELEEGVDSKVLVVRVSDKLQRVDHERFVPEVKRLIKNQGKVHLLFDMHGFHGWTMGAM